MHTNLKASSTKSGCAHHVRFCGTFAFAITGEYLLTHSLHAAFEIVFAVIFGDAAGSIAGIMDVTASCEVLFSFNCKKFRL